MSSALPPSVEQVLEVLQHAVSAELGRKRLLGHYTVTWPNGQPVLEGPDAPRPEG
jgi:hypothetical protein